MIPLKDAHLKFIEHLKEKNRSNSTVLAYGKDIDQLVEFLEELKRARVTDVSQPDVEAFLAKLLKNGYTPKSVSRKTITDCIIPTINPKTHVVIGVDNGVVKTVVIGNIHGIFKVYETESWEEIEADLGCYNATMVIDANPYPTRPKQLATKYPGRVFVHYFVQEQKDLQIIRWGEGDKDGVVVSDRTKIIDMVVSELKNKDIIFNLTLAELEQYIYDWTQLYRTIEESQGIQKPVWRTIQDRRDHFAFAQIYWRIALEKVFVFGGVVRTPSKKEASLAKKSVAVAPDGTIPAIDVKEVLQRSTKGKKDWRTK